MEAAVQVAIASIHAAPSKAVIIAAGGGSQALGWLVACPGASATVLEALLPHSRPSFLSFLRQYESAAAVLNLNAGLSSQQQQSSPPLPSQFVSSQATRRLAAAAFNRGLTLCPAAQSQQELWECTLTLGKGNGRLRLEEDTIVSRLLISTIARSFDLPSSDCHLPLHLQTSTSRHSASAPCLREGDTETGSSDSDDNSDSSNGNTDSSSSRAEREPANVSGSGSVSSGGSSDCNCDLLQDGAGLPASVWSEEQQLQRVLDGHTTMATFLPGSGSGSSEGGEEGGSFSSSSSISSVLRSDGRRVVLSGSFNPLHEGHLGLMRAALRLVPGGVPCFEIAAVNADKGAVRAEELRGRVKAITAAGFMAAVTPAPLFSSKAIVFADSSFVVGFDTAIRLLDPKYYGGSSDRMHAVLQGIAELGCDFLVAGRLVGGRYMSFEQLEVPDALRPMFRCISEADFRADLSSTELRARAAAAAAAQQQN